MKRLLKLFILTILALSSCSKNDDMILETVFGEKILQSPAGNFMVLFQGKGVWSVTSDQEWIHVENRTYKDEAAFEVRYDSNESTIGDHRFCRVGEVSIISADGTWKSVMHVRQEGIAPYMQLTSASFPSEAGQYTLNLLTNLTDKERKAVTFSCDVPWISDITLGRDGQSVLIKLSSGSARSGKVTMTFTDEWERIHTATATVTQ